MRPRLVAIGVLGLAVLLLCALPLRANSSGKVKVFILAGQSNMEGKAKMSLLEYQAEQPETRNFFKHLRKDGKWVVRDDAWINFLNRRGNLTVGFGSPKCIGPELEFGNAVADHFHEQGRFGLRLSLSRKRNHLFENRSSFRRSDTRNALYWRHKEPTLLTTISVSSSLKLRLPADSPARKGGF